MFVWLSGSAFCFCSFHVLATAAKYEQQKQSEKSSQTSLAAARERAPTSPSIFRCLIVASISYSVRGVVCCFFRFCFSESDLCSNIFTLLRLSENFSIVTLRLLLSDRVASSCDQCCWLLLLSFIIISSALWHSAFVLFYNFICTMRFHGGARGNKREWKGERQRERERVSWAKCGRWRSKLYRFIDFDNLKLLWLQSSKLTVNDFNMYIYVSVCLQAVQ